MPTRRMSIEVCHWDVHIWKWVHAGTSSDVLVYVLPYTHAGSNCCRSHAWAMAVADSSRCFRTTSHRNARCALCLFVTRCISEWYSGLASVGPGHVLIIVRWYAKLHTRWNLYIVKQSLYCKTVRQYHDIADISLMSTFLKGSTSRVQQNLILQAMYISIYMYVYIFMYIHVSSWHTQARIQIHAITYTYTNIHKHTTT